MSKCIGCGVEIQYEDDTRVGYAMYREGKETIYCQRCYKMKNFNQVPYTYLKNEDFIEILKQVGASKKPVIWVIDLFDFEGSYLNEVENYLIDNPIIVVGNKVDLIPKSVKREKLQMWLAETINQDVKLSEIELISAIKKHNVDELVAKIASFNVDQFYVVGVTNAGKSTLINQIAKSLNPKQETGIITSYYAGTTLGMIDIKLETGVVITDTPGIINDHQTTNYVTKDTLKVVIPKNEIRPQTFQIEGEQTLFLSGMVQFDYLSNVKTSFTVYISNEINIHRTKLENSQDIRSKHLGEKLLMPPSKKDLEIITEWEVINIKIPRNSNKQDVVISGMGWITINRITTAMEFNVTVPKGIKVTLRNSII